MVEGEIYEDLFNCIFRVVNFSLQNIYMKIMISNKIIIRHKFCGSFESYPFILVLNIALNPMKNGDQCSCTVLEVKM